MYITLSNLQNGQYVPFNQPIDNREGIFEIALVEMCYYNRWTNISSVLANKSFQYGGKAYTVQDGYYNICDLQKYYFSPLKMSLDLNSATGLVTVWGIKEKLSLGTLGPTLGFVDRGGPLKSKHHNRLSVTNPSSLQRALCSP